MTHWRSSQNWNNESWNNSSWTSDKSWSSSSWRGGWRHGNLDDEHGQKQREEPDTSTLMGSETPRIPSGSDTPRIPSTPLLGTPLGSDTPRIPTGSDTPRIPSTPLGLMTPGSSTVAPHIPAPARPSLGFGSSIPSRIPSTPPAALHQPSCLPPGWERHFSRSHGKIYFYHRESQISQYEFPAAVQTGGVQPFQTGIAMTSSVSTGGVQPFHIGTTTVAPEGAGRLYEPNPQPNIVYPRGTEMPGFSIRGFILNPGLNGLYERKADPEHTLEGSDGVEMRRPTSTYWNLEAPAHRPVFMYWQYYKDHHSICSRYIEYSNEDYWALVKSTGQGVGLAFYKHDTKEWFEAKGDEFVPCRIEWRCCSEEELRLRSHTQNPVLAGAGRQTVSLARTPSKPIARTPMFANVPRTPAGPPIAKIPGTPRVPVRAPVTNSGQPGLVTPITSSSSSSVSAQTVMVPPKLERMCEELNRDIMRKRGGGVIEVKEEIIERAQRGRDHREVEIIEIKDEPEMTEVKLERDEAVRQQERLRELQRIKEEIRQCDERERKRARTREDKRIDAERQLQEDQKQREERQRRDAEQQLEQERRQQAERQRVAEESRLHAEAERQRLEEERRLDLERRNAELEKERLEKAERKRIAEKRCREAEKEEKRQARVAKKQRLEQEEAKIELAAVTAKRVADRQEELREEERRLCEERLREEEAAGVLDGLEERINALGGDFNQELSPTSPNETDLDKLIKD